MPSSHASRTHAPLLLLAGLAAFLLFLPTTQARAADRDLKGWFAALDLADTQPNSLDQHFANQIDPANNDVKRLVIDNKTHLSWRGQVGYAFGKELGSLQAAFWIYDHEDSQSGTSGTAIYPTIFGYGDFGGGMYITNAPSTFEAKGKVKARTADLDYVRPIAVSEKFSLKWLAGLRVARYEEDQSFRGTDAATNQYLQSKHIEAKATGLRIGVTGVFGFTKHFSLEASITSSFMQGSTDGRSLQAFSLSGITETEHGSDDHIRGEIRDYDLRAVWTYRHHDLYLGYADSTWDGLPTDPVGGVGGGLFGIGPVESRGRQAISFNSFHGGIVWRFGRTQEPLPLQ